MIVAEQSSIVAPVRQITAWVESCEDSTLFKHTDRLKSFTIERVGDTDKFFGFGICQRLNVKLIDKDRELDFSTANTFKVVLGGQENLYPIFKVSEVNRDEATNALSITAYDALYQAANHTVSELELPQSYTIYAAANTCATLLGLPLLVDEDANECFQTNYPEGANLEGTENLREFLDAIAEATQTIYYIDGQGKLFFKRLDKEGEPVFLIDKNVYFSLKNGDNRRLAAVCSSTELGDNYIAALEVSGTKQYIRDNPFWDTQENIAELVEAALAVVGGLTVNQFECDWRGNYLLEIGDKIGLETKDGETVYSYMIDDTISYDGSLSEKTQWQYTDNENESLDNPTSIGDALKKTYAKVDKANKQIELVVSEVEDNGRRISSIEMTTDDIVASVEEVKKQTVASNNELEDKIQEISNKVEATMTSEEISIAIKKEIDENGVEKITTSTGFTFDEEGLTITKKDKEMKTQITEDGMTIYRDNTAMLIANNTGVEATNLHATTYLIIGTNSRFEDYDGNRTGCFWIGG